MIEKHQAPAVRLPRWGSARRTSMAPDLGQPAVDNPDEARWVTSGRHRVSVKICDGSTQANNSTT